MKEQKVYLLHIIDAISQIFIYTKNYKLNDFIKDRKTQDSVIRQILVIGEAVKNIDNRLIENNSQIPWKEIAKTRDKLVHGYFGIDLNLVWDIVKLELPKLKKEIEKILLEDKF